MAWTLHWQCCFASAIGRQYAVNIYQDGYAGNVIQLTGAEDPFTTNESDEDNIFTPIRKQTGYLRLIDTDGTLLESLMPETNTQYLVRLMLGTYTNGTFTPNNPDKSVWFGYLRAQAFTQSWDGQVKMVEFPVKSMLATLEDVQVPVTNSTLNTPIAKLITTAFQAVGATGMDFYVIDDGVEDNNFLYPYINWSVLFDEETVSNQGETVQQLVGVSYYEALSRVLAPFGLTAMERFGDIYIAHYDMIANMQCRTTIYGWDDLITIGNGQTALSLQLGAVSQRNILDAVTFGGDDNVIGYLPGAKSAKVELTIDDVPAIITQPETVSKNNAVYEKSVYDNRPLYVQLQAPRENANETYTYIKQNHYEYIGETDAYEMWTKSWVYGYSYNPYYSSSTPQVTGALPCRWFLQRLDTDVPRLTNGLYFSTMYPYGSSSGRTIRKSYSIASGRSFNMTGGWININFEYYGTYTADGKVYMVESDTNSHCDLCVAIRIGSKFWNKGQRAWVESNDPLANIFTIKTSGRNIDSNKTVSMYVDEATGFFIPIDTICGEVEFYISNYSYAFGTNVLQPRTSSCFILSNMTVKYCPQYSISASDRRSNVYLQQILMSGFKDEETINLSYGTFNNNKFSPSFLMQSDSSFIQQMTYNTGDNTTETQRPELRLLARMAAYYAVVRRTLIAVVTGYESYSYYLYNYQGRRFMAVLKRTNWRDNTQEVKFIEVTKPQQ